MTPDQIAIVAILVVTIALFISGRLRVDVTALLALLACVVLGLVPADEAFDGFGHPAVITVAAVLGLSAALIRSGAIDAIASRVDHVAKGHIGQVVALSSLGGVFSGFMNNVGALALLMPVALSMARRGGYGPGLILMPLAFATILGGMTTLIGTPPNLLVSDYRRRALGEGFALFDFAWVGLPLAITGIAFITLVGWRLLPHRKASAGGNRPFDVEGYLTELVVPEGAPAIGKTVDEVIDGIETPPMIDAVVRGRNQVIRHVRHAKLQAGDVVMVHGEAEAIESLAGRGLTMLAAKELEREDGAGPLDRDALALVEVVVPPRAWIRNRSPAMIALRVRYGVNLLAVAREGKRIESRLRDVRFQAGDVLLLQGERETLSDTIALLGCLPLAERHIALQPKRALVPVAVFVAALLAIGFGLLPAAAALTAALLAMVLTRLMPMQEVYAAIDLQVVVLLAAMIPVGGALQSSGTAQILADALAHLAGEASPRVLLAVLLIVTMSLSDIMNNAATTVVMAPIGLGVAVALGTSPDPMLMAVAIGSSAAFLTPIGHQNNLLVMGPGGYRFGDYWRMGLPLEILLVAIGVWLIPVAWPF
ncbi:MAG: SLC13 family permease [Alphaproteobacteria bacterium]|nr:SLC13 family permease [Alphaproteobacteria bacterium]